MLDSLKRASLQAQNIYSFYDQLFTTVIYEWAA